LLPRVKLRNRVSGPHNEAVEKLTGATIASLAFLHCQTFQ
jgi:hypothetical protein